MGADNIIEKTESDVSELLKKTEEDVVKTTQQAQTIVQDTLRGGGRLIDNSIGNVAHTVRFAAKNVVGLIDNTQDHIYSLTQDIRTDVTNTVQIFTIITATGLAAFFILYGDKVLKQGLQVGSFELF